MSDPLNGKPPEDVLPYAPNWARQSGYRPTLPGAGYDAFSDEENPSYRSMAQMFAPEPERPKKRTNSSTKMLLRFGGVVGIVGAALALFIGYVGTQKAADDETAERFKGVSNAVAAIQAAISPPQMPATAPAESKPAAAPKSVAKPAVKNVAPKAVASDPAPAPAPATEAPVTSARGAAPGPAPAEQEAPAPTSSPQIAALPKDIPPAPLPEPAAPAAPELSAGELATLMARGRRFIDSGDFSSARPVYRRAAEAGYAEAALALGETYDPITLEERGVIGMNADVAQARHWYERARELGSLEAPTRLERLATF